MTTKEQAKAQVEEAFRTHAGRKPDEGDLADFENRWAKTHEAHADWDQRKPYSDDPRLAHEKPGIDDPKARVSWASMFEQTLKSLRDRFPKEDPE